MDKQKFRKLCIEALHEYEAEQEGERQKKEAEENKQRQQHLKKFLNSHLRAEGFREGDEELEFEVKDAVYQGEGFLLTVGSREDKLPVIAEATCRDQRCGAVLVQQQVKNLAEIGAVILQAEQEECPNCESQRSINSVFGD